MLALRVLMSARQMYIIIIIIVKQKNAGTV